MLLSSLSLLLCWKAWARKSFRLLWQDAELLLSDLPGPGPFCPHSYHSGPV